MNEYTVALSRTIVSWIPQLPLGRANTGPTSRRFRPQAPRSPGRGARAESAPRTTTRFSRRISQLDRYSRGPTRHDCRAMSRIVDPLTTGGDGVTVRYWKERPLLSTFAMTGNECDGCGRVMGRSVSQGAFAGGTVHRGHVARRERRGGNGLDVSGVPIIEGLAVVPKSRHLTGNAI